MRRPWRVEVDEVGDPAWDARDSTSSIVFDCHPLLTLTIAYERRVRSSEESWEMLVTSLGDDVFFVCVYLANLGARRGGYADSTGISRMPTSMVSVRTRWGVR